MTKTFVETTASELGASLAQGAYALSDVAKALAILTQDGRADAARYFFDLAYRKAGDVGWDVGRRGLVHQPDADAVSRARSKLAMAVGELRGALNSLERLAEHIGLAGRLTN